MVTIHNPELKISSNGQVQPVMREHRLSVKKNAPSFKKGTTVTCYIAKYDNGRFCVWDSSWTSQTNYHVFDSLTELNNTFDELP